MSAALPTGRGWSMATRMRAAFIMIGAALVTFVTVIVPAIGDKKVIDAASFISRYIERRHDYLLAPALLAAFGGLVFWLLARPDLTQREIKIDEPSKEG